MINLLLIILCVNASSVSMIKKIYKCLGGTGYIWITHCWTLDKPTTSVTCPCEGHIIGILKLPLHWQYPVLMNREMIHDYNTCVHSAQTSKIFLN